MTRASPRLAKFGGHPLSVLLAVIGTLLVISSVATLFRAPAVELAASLIVRDFEIRVGGRPAVVQDIAAERIAIERFGAIRPPSDNPLERSSDAGLNRTSIGSASSRRIKLDTLIVPPGGLLVGRYDSRGGKAIISVEPPRETPTDSEATFVWYDAAAESNDGMTTATAGSRRFTGSDLTIEFQGPNFGASEMAPFRIAGLGLSRSAAGTNANYPVSAVVGGTLRFLVMGTALDETRIDEGETLRFSDLQAELTSFGIDRDGFKLRLVGRTGDVEKGYGSALTSEYPTAFAGLSVLPIVQVIVATVMGVLFALVGAVSLGSSGDRPSG